MPRNHNTNQAGGNWTPEQVKEVWEKGTPAIGYSKDLWRHDKCGAVMKWTDHGNRDSKSGWEIDHINPVSNGGSDSIGNLQPLNWENNAKKGDSLNWKCK